MPFLLLVGQMKIMDTIRKLFGVSVIPENIDRKTFFEREIARWKNGLTRHNMFVGERYYEGKHDILFRKQTMMGDNGEHIEMPNLPNNKAIDNKFAELVDQKANYLLSKPITFETGNDANDIRLKEVFDRQFLNKLKNGGIDAIWGGLFWLYVYYDQEGKLAFQRFKPYEVLPFWKDNEHTELDCAVRLYPVEVYEGSALKIIEKVEIFTLDGIERYVLNNGRLIEDVENPSGFYAYIGEKGYNWERIPLIAFKANAKELSLVDRVKSLQDALNLMTNDFLNNMQQNVHNSILVLQNYDGENGISFRHNVAKTGVIKVKTVDGVIGDAKVLNIEVNAQNYDLVLKSLKKSIIENGRGFDAKDDRLGSNANQMNLRSMYSSIDLDADNMEAEFQSSFEQLMFFVKAYLGDIGDVTITFNRDIMVNETEVIDNLTKLGVKLPNELLVAQVPFVDDVTKVMQMLDDEEQKAIDAYGGAFPNPEPNGE